MSRVMPAAEVTGAGIRPLRITGQEFGRFRALIYREAGIALGEHKRELVCSRLGKRLRRYGYRTFSEYWEHLQERDPEGRERLRLVNAITTNKTEFFREEHHFPVFRSTILTRPAVERYPPWGLRVWSAGCSSGEEPYSIALTVLDALGGASARGVRILASDINTDMLARAEEGVYTPDQIELVPAALRGKCFVRSAGAPAGSVAVCPQLRDLVTFRRINLAESWPIRKPLDCIFCRNVLIYFDRALQERCVSRFVELLRPNGYLFLGGSESLLGMRPELRNLGHSVYQKVGG
jgi:chemotaxis protein methyltransferase CheR